MQIIDNFLDKDIFNSLKKEILLPSLDWHRDLVTNGDVNFYFSHLIFYQTESSYLFKYMKPILEKLECKALIRIKINYYTPDCKIIKHSNHIDYNFTHKGALLHLNTCEGGTYYKNQFIESKENRMVLFDPSIEHCSTNTTAVEGRININFNYF